MLQPANSLALVWDADVADEQHLECTETKNTTANVAAHRRCAAKTATTYK